jgi:hypothetical protein
MKQKDIPLMYVTPSEILTNTLHRMSRFGKLQTWPARTIAISTKKCGKMY